ncbi:sodium/hydrogen exchanger 9B1 isoform X2 [Zeugodacus cucurbitae]|uniref:sodium/hydrogen exchanger 9B1 isoform X2 n=1 Tax=Zeugodacus cucurbitae TaxID=28588 RepID=UPI0023D8F7C0|nr:sodium/hydrogen exchanger 9B1 isoform X2 [Zeugodacus cucurbitae]
MTNKKNPPTKTMNERAETVPDVLVNGQSNGSVISNAGDGNAGILTQHNNNSNSNLNNSNSTNGLNHNNSGIAVPIPIVPNAEISVINTTPMPVNHFGNSGSYKNTIVIDNQPKRKVSIVSDPASEARSIGAYDNPAYEQNPHRKISQTSTHSHTEFGPTRRKSILVNSSTNVLAPLPLPNAHDNESDRGSLHSYGDNSRPYRSSALDNLNAKIYQHQQEQALYGHGNKLEESWIYSFCLKCHGEENRPSWEPPYWQKICPYPLCPSFRQFARLLVLILIGVLIWFTAYIIIGDSAAPGGQLFNLVVLTVAANFGGWLISLTTLPRLIGMLLVGILFQNVGWVHLDGDFSHVTSHLRKFALTIILIRAGLEMEPEAFRKVYKTILKLGVIPWFMEAVAISLTTHFLLDLPWIWSFLLGSVIAAVSPAVVVPCLFRLRSKGYGVAKGIPTLIIAVSGIDDALSVALFGIISSVMFSDRGLAFQISQAPICIIGGLAFGVIWGYMARFFPEKGDEYVVPLRAILLFTGGLVAIYGSDRLEYEGAGPLAVVFAAFTSNLFWCKQGWEVDDNPVGTAFEIIWMIFEPILFGITGATIKINELDGDVFYIGVACIVVSSVIRILCTAGIAFGDRLNTKEKFFVAISWMSKATVQAALAPVALRNLGPDATEAEKRYAYIVQTLCVLSIVLTAPLGAILITLSGPRLLTRTKQPQVLEGWRRSHRPSIRDISIIDEEEEREDPELPADKTTADNTQSNAHINNIGYGH